MAKRLSWVIRIERAEERGYFTWQEHDWAGREWTTCAIGEKHNWSRSNGPRSRKEWDLGIMFGYAVKHNEFSDAKQLYTEIMALPN